jgi:hypothetical protein
MTDFNALAIIVFALFVMFFICCVICIMAWIWENWQGIKRLVKYIFNIRGFRTNFEMVHDYNVRKRTEQEREGETEQQAEYEYQKRSELSHNGDDSGDIG